MRWWFSAKRGQEPLKKHLHFLNCLGYLHSQPTKRVHRVWTNATINQIGFLQPKVPICCTQQHCGQSAVPPHLGSFWLQKRANHTPAMDIARLNCCCCCGSSWVPSCLCANDICNRLSFAMFDCFQTSNNNKINYVGPRIGTWLILTVSPLEKPFTYSWLTENVKRCNKEESDTHS